MHMCIIISAFAHTNIFTHTCIHTCRKRYSRMAHSGALRDVDGVGGVGELRGPQTCQYGHWGMRTLPALSVYGLHSQSVLFTRAQRSSCGPDFSQASVHLKTILTAYSKHTHTRNRHRVHKNKNTSIEQTFCRRGHLTEEISMFPEGYVNLNNHTLSKMPL